jgi:DNA-binding response OmpR family regulator
VADILAQVPYEVGRCGWDQLAAELQARSPNLLVLLEEAGAVQPLIRRLKADDTTWDLPIIVGLTEFSDTAAAWALEAGADEFLLPPFEPREVLARVAVVLRLQHDRRLLLASHEEFSRIFQETAHPLFFCLWRSYSMPPRIGSASGGFSPNRAQGITSSCTWCTGRASR